MKNIPKQYHSAVRKLIKKAVDKERVRSAFIVEEMMEDSEHWQPIAGRILGRTIIKKEDIINLIKKEL